MSTSIALTTAFGLAAGNFIWQFCGDSLYAVAVERTFFQWAALGTAWIVAAMNGATA